MTLDTTKPHQFIDEYHCVVGGDRSLSEANLPDPAQFTTLPTVVIPRRQLIAFRNDFMLLAKFAAWAAGVEIDTLSVVDLDMATFRIAEMQRKAALYDASELE